MDRILVIGALGQLGTELCEELIRKYGEDQVIQTDIKDASTESPPNYRFLDASDGNAIDQIVQEENITRIYHLAAILSAKGEEKPLIAWELNMRSLLNVLEIAKSNPQIRIFWPSSIAVFGPDTPKENVPQRTIANPTTVYGISKLAGEKWCEYYFRKYNVDVRSIRYPGLVGYKSMPGGGTTDYAVDIYHQALKNKHYQCFLREDSYLPMMYMPDAVKATLQLMDSDAEEIQVRTSYNLASFSASPREFYLALKKHIPNFTIEYQPDFRQEIADSWPDSVDDTPARLDWKWNPDFDLDKMTTDILKNLQ